MHPRLTVRNSLVVSARPGDRTHRSGGHLTGSDGESLRRVDPETGEFTVVVEGVELTGANGISFAPDYDKLYVGIFGGGTIYEIPMADDGTATGPPVIFYSGIGYGGLDALSVDACGNVYTADFTNAAYRITPDGEEIETIAEGIMWWASFQWGSGVGGWKSDSLYVATMGSPVIEIDTRVPGKPRVYP